MRYILLVFLLSFLNLSIGQDDPCIQKGIDLYEADKYDKALTQLTGCPNSE